MKPCPCCKRHLRVALPASVAFNLKTDAIDGLQPWCRTCDWDGKATLAEAWNRFQRVLRAEPQSAPMWTEDLYLQVLGEMPECNWCGAQCREWGIGHWIDRVSSAYGHIPSNSVVCCSPCNFHKGHKPSSGHEMYLRGLLQSCKEFPSGTGRHPWGKIPWNDYPSSSRHFKRVSAPDLSAHVVADPQLSLFGGSAA